MLLSRFGVTGKLGQHRLLFSVTQSCDLKKRFWINHSQYYMMDHQSNRQAEGSYETRNDLAIRSAAADAAAEPRSDPQANATPTSPKSKRTSLQAKQASNTQPDKATQKSKAKQKPSDPSNSSKPPNAPLPDFIVQRNKLFDELKRKRDEEILAKDKPAINVVIDLGSDKDGKPRPLMPAAGKAW